MKTPLISIPSLLVVCLVLALPIGAQSPTPDPAPDPARDQAPDDSLAGLPQPNPPRAAAKDGEEEGIGDDATARLLAQRREFGSPSPEFRRRLMQERSRRQSLDRAAKAGISSGGSGPVWVPIGPEGADYETNGGSTGYIRDSGRVRKILPHPTDPDTLYLLTSGGGLWVTHNFTSASTNWAPLTDNLPTTGGGSVAFGRTPNVLYLGLGDPFDVINIGGSMAKSIDGGATWSSPIDLGNALSIRDILVDSSGPDDILVVATDDGLYRSVDSGASYAKIQGGAGELLQGQVIWSLARTSAGIVAEAQPCPVTPAVLCKTAGGLFVSIDQGAIWTPIPNGGGVFSGAGRATIGVGVQGDAIVYAFAEVTAANDQLDLFRSTDGGLNWTALGINAKIPANSNSDNPNMDLMRTQSWYNQMILIDSRDPSRNTIYLGGQLGSARTSDGGGTWTLLSNWLPFSRFSIPYMHADFHAAAMSLSGTPTVLFGGDGGLFVSMDDGTTWSSDKNNGLQTFLTYSLTSTPGFPEAVLAGFQDNGSRIRKGDTKIYNQSRGGDGTGTGWSQRDKGMAVTSVPGNSYGINFTSQVPDLIASFVLAFAPTNNDAIFEVPVVLPDPALDPTGKLFYSTTLKRLVKFDFSLSPPLVFTLGQISSGSSTTFRGCTHSVGVSPVDLLHIGVPLSGGLVNWTTNGGASFGLVAMNTAVPGFQSSAQSFTWVDNQTMFVTSVAPVVGAVRVVKSVNGGASWARSDAGLPDVQIERVVVDLHDATHQSLYAATYAGVYRSTDGGANWAPFGTGLPSVAVRDLYLPPDGSFIRIGTYGRGLWEVPLLSYVGATLTDDLASCDHDGSVDNGETGRLTVTLRNDGAAALSHLVATVTCTNPAVSFPGGNVIIFPAASPSSEVAGSVPVLMTGAAGIQRLDFTIAYNDSDLGLAAPVTGVASFRANFDEVPNGSAGDDVEAANSPWTITGLPTVIPDILNWKRVEISPLEHRWLGIDSNLATDQSLVSPVLSVGSGDFTISFEQRYRFEFVGGTNPSYFDGLVLELSADGGASWSDIGAFASPGYNHTIATGFGNVIEGRPAFTGPSTNYPTPFIATTIDLGTAYAGQSVQIRFRIGTDQFGYAPGVELRNIATTGLANTPFTAVVPDRALCPPPGEVHNQVWASKTTMIWDHEPSLGTYNLYRDLISTLPGGFGGCLQSGIATESATDAALPAVGAGWFYIVTARNNLGQEGTKGFQSGGMERSNPAPCP
jgi:photosystem II stability/assembly factor-like uncharacterized protein